MRIPPPKQLETKESQHLGSPELSISLALPEMFSNGDSSEAASNFPPKRGNWVFLPDGAGAIR